MKYYPHIDGLRAVAVLSVILCHFRLAGFSGGYVGVDVFFVISGFLITGILFDMIEKRRFSLAHFYERRARRILPALVLTCVLALAAALVLLVPDDFAQFSWSLEGVAGFASNFVFARTVGYFEPSALSKPLLHTWSLAVEEQFYVVFPLLLYGLARCAGSRRRAFTLSLCGIFLVSLAISVIFIRIAPEKTFYLLPARAWELMAGGLLALNLQKLSLSAPAREAMGWAGAGLLATCAAFYDSNTVFPGLAAIPPCAAAVLLIVSDLKSPTRVGRLLASRPAVAVGTVSYGLYLFHWPVLIFTRYYLDRSPPPSWIAFDFLLVAALATASYFYVEKPARLGRVFASRRAVFASSCAVLLALGLTGVAGKYTQGFPGRFDGAALAFVTGAAEKDPFTCAKQQPQDVTVKTACRIGRDKARPDFLLWGDSHASSLAAAVDALAKKRGLSGQAVIESGCPALLGVERADGFVSVSCREAGEAALRLIRAEHIRNVLLVTRWEMYSLGYEKGGIETVREPHLAFASGKTSSEGWQAFSDSFAETIRRLRAEGVNVWVVKQVPTYLFNVPSALAKASYLGRDIASLRRPYADVIARRDPIDAVFASAPGAHFIDPVKKFCPGRAACLVAVDGHSLYKDQSHLSVYGALWSEDMLLPFFDGMHLSG